MAKADGIVSRDEIAAFRERVHIPPSEVKQVGKFWDLARQTPAGYEDYANQVAHLFLPKPLFWNSSWIYCSILPNQMGIYPHLSKITFITWQKFLVLMTLNLIV